MANKDRIPTSLENQENAEIAATLESINEFDSFSSLSPEERKAAAGKYQRFTQAEGSASGAFSQKGKYVGMPDGMFYAEEVGESGEFKVFVPPIIKAEQNTVVDDTFDIIRREKTQGLARLHAQVIKPATFKRLPSGELELYQRGVIVRFTPEEWELIAQKSEGLQMTAEMVGRLEEFDKTLNSFPSLSSESYFYNRTRPELMEKFIAREITHDGLIDELNRIKTNANKKPDRKSPTPPPENRPMPPKPETPPTQREKIIIDLSGGSYSIDESGPEPTLKPKSIFQRGNLYGATRYFRFLQPDDSKTGQFKITVIHPAKVKKGEGGDWELVEKGELDISPAERENEAPSLEKIPKWSLDATEILVIEGISRYATDLSMREKIASIISEHTPSDAADILIGDNYCRPGRDDIVRVINEFKPKTSENPPAQPEAEPVKPETGHDPEIWEMTQGQYLDWCRTEGILDVNSPKYAEELEAAIAHYKSSIAAQLEENPNSVPENVREEYARATEKQPQQLDASISQNPSSSVEKPEPPTETNTSLENELNDLQFQRALQEVIEKQITNEKRLASVLKTNATKAIELLDRLEKQGIISPYDKKSKPPREILWNRKQLREIIARTRGSRRAKESTIQEALESEDLYVRCIALLLAESRKGKPFSQRGLLMEKFELDRKKTDEIFTRLVADGLIKKDGLRTILNHQAMADYLKTLSENPPTQKEEVDQEEPKSERVFIPEKIPNADNKIGGKVNPQLELYNNPEDPLSPRWETGTPVPQQVPPPVSEGIKTEETLPETLPAETIKTYTEKIYSTANNLLIRKNKAETRLAQLTSPDPEIQKSLDALVKLTLQATDKVPGIREALNTAGERFDEGGINHGEYLIEAQKILDQAHQEINPILERAEQEISAIEDQINSLPQLEENPAEAGIATADKATEAEIDKSENPTAIRRWMSKARKHFLRIALALLIGAGGGGYAVYKTLENRGEKEKAAEVLKKSEETAPTQKPTPPFEDTVSQKKEGVDQERVQDSIKNPDDFIPAKEPTKEERDKTIDQALVAREEAIRAQAHSQVEPPPPPASNVS